MKVRQKNTFLTLPVAYLLLLCIAGAVIVQMVKVDEKRKASDAILVGLRKSEILLYKVEVGSLTSIDSDALLQLQSIGSTVEQNAKVLTLPRQIEQAIQILSSAFFKLKIAHDNKLFRSTNYQVNSNEAPSRLSVSYLQQNLLIVLPYLEEESSNLRSRFNLLIVVVGSCLFVGFIGAPLLNYFNHQKPLQSLVSVLKKYSHGEKIEIQDITSDKDVRDVAAEIKKLIDDQNEVERFIDQVNEGDLDLAYQCDREDSHMGKSLFKMQQKLKSITDDEKKNSWISNNTSILEKYIKEEGDLTVLAKRIISLLTTSISAGVGILYRLDGTEEQFFNPLASYGLSEESKSTKKVYVGNGQLGQLGIERKTILIADIPSGYLVVESGLGASTPHSLVMIPLLFKDKLYGAIEVAAFKSITTHEVAWLERAAASIAAHLFNYKIHYDSKKELEALAEKQANDLVEIQRLQSQTYYKLEQKLKEVEDEKIKNMAILEGCVDGVISFNECGVVHFCNKTAQEIFALSKEEIIMKRISELIPVRIDEIGNKLFPFLLTKEGEKEITVRTEVSINDAEGGSLDMLITSTQVNINSGILFTFFIQKISADLF
jgi:PAS domain-containing protein